MTNKGFTAAILDRAVIVNSILDSVASLCAGNFPQIIGRICRSVMLASSEVFVPIHPNTNLQSLLGTTFSAELSGSGTVARFSHRLMRAGCSVAGKN
jgi:hypothetical protein